MTRRRMFSMLGGMGTRLDELFPRWRHRERHRLALEAPPAAVWRAIDEVTWGEVPVFRILMRIRTLGRARLALDRPILETMTSGGFYVLDRTDQEMVVGVIGRLSRGQGAAPGRLLGDRFRDFDEPGHVKAGFSFRYTPGLLTTETRVWPADRRSRWLFRLYWTVIRLPSGLIRRVWLRAIRRRALRSAGTPAALA